MKTTGEIAKEENVTVYYVSAWAKKRGLPTFGGKYMFDEEAEKEFKSRRKIKEKTLDNLRRS